MRPARLYKPLGLTSVNMVENVYGIPRKNFEHLMDVDPNESLRNLLYCWSRRPTAFAVIFVPGHEQAVIDFIFRGLPTDYDQTVVLLPELMERYPENGHVFESFFIDEIQSGKVPTGRKRVYLFRGADELDDEQIRYLKHASDGFTREGRLAPLLSQFPIFPLVMESLTTTHRFLMVDDSGGFRMLERLFFTGV